MIEKIFECRKITLTDELNCYEFEMIVLNNDIFDALAFHLTHYACSDPENIFVDELKYFDRIDELDNYFKAKINEFKVKGFY